MLLRTTLRRQAYIHLSARVRTGQHAFTYAGVNDLGARIQSDILGATHVDPEAIKGALAACRRHLVEIQDREKLLQDVANTKVLKNIEVLLGSDKVPFSAQLLKDALLLDFPLAGAIKIIQMFYQRNSGSAIDLATALIPFRKCLFDGDTRTALRVVDLTTGHPNYISAKHRRLRSGVLRFAATAIGITAFSKVGVTQLVGLGLLQPAWTHLGSINAMILTYLFNLTFFVTIVKFGRQLSAAGGDYLTWQKGTFYTHWYKHADEMSMCTRVLETDIKLNGGIEPSPWLIQELCRTGSDDETGTLTPGLTRSGEKIRLLAPKDNLEELKLQAYWMSGGDGFEWVEPDQDPADILWRRHLRTLHRPELGDKARSLKWAEDLI